MEHGYLWLALGLLLGVIEIMVGTYYLLALIGGALLTGIFSLIIPLELIHEVLLFGFASLASLVPLLRWKKDADKEHHTDDITRLHGRSVIVIEKIAPAGRVRHKGVEWNAEAEDVIDVGETAVIEHVRGSTLYVKKHIRSPTL